MLETALITATLKHGLESKLLEVATKAALEAGKAAWSKTRIPTSFSEGTDVFRDIAKAASEAAIQQLKIEISNVIGDISLIANVDVSNRVTEAALKAGNAAWEKFRIPSSFDDIKGVIKEMSEAAAKAAIQEFRTIRLESFAEKPALTEQLNLIKENSLESLKAQVSPNSLNESRISQIRVNREDGKLREDIFYDELKSDYSEVGGYKILREVPLRDSEGNIVKDPSSNESRRLDFVVTKDDIAIKSFEVTSENAPKEFQMEKEARIRDAGGNFIKDKTTNTLIEIPGHVETKVIRRA